MRTLIIILIAIPQFLFAQIPAYYSGIDYSKNGDALKAELRTLVTNTLTNPLEYTSSSLPDTWDALKQSDLDTGSNMNVLLVYGYNDTDAITKNDRTRHKDSSCHTSGCNGLWNREHVYPQSLSNPSMTTQFPGTGTDVHNLRASDGQANTSRGNDKYALGSGNAVSLSSNTFYPGDEWQGDIARIIMYMYLRYDNECQATNVGTGSASFSPSNDMPNIFLIWNSQDPPSQYEKNRNNIFQSMQGNRNPFIDNPYLATKIWNGPQALNTWGALTTPSIDKNNIKVYPTITTGKLYIQKRTMDDKLSYSLYNAFGFPIRTSQFIQSLDLSNLAKGMYFIKFNDYNYPAQKIILN